MILPPCFLLLMESGLILWMSEWFNPRVSARRSSKKMLYGMFWYLLAGKNLLTHDELLLFKFRNQIFSRWLQHSIMARKVFKTTFGLWHHPLERPLFATGAWLAWGAQVVFWRPITDCQKWNPLTISLPVAAVSITIIVSSPFSLIFQLYPNVYLTSHHCRH